MTPEREIAIRKQFSTDNHLPLSIHMPVIELLAEIDRLRDEREGLFAELIGQEHRLGILYETAERERDQLREKLLNSEKVRQETYKDLLTIEKERDKLRDLLAIVLKGTET